jgi:ketosteroid isomerase-like protein
MSSETNETRETVGTLFRLLAEGDADRIGDIFAERIDWFVPGDEKLPWTGHRSQRHEVPEYFKTMWPVFVPGASEVVMDKVIVEGPEAVALGRFTHTVAANGRRFSTPVAFHLTVDDGRIVRLHLYEDTFAAAAAVNG